MAPSLKGKRKKKSVPMADSEFQEMPGVTPEEEHQDNLEKLEQVVSPAVKQDEAEQKPLEEDSGDEEMLSSEKEEEQTFLVNLYKFMKERHTPIERVPHLGFKQINLFKIYKAVEKLGAYELVTGRRLWKNVYDMLGGSPGSTSAATCTRRHYERLVLPYVRHLKGEDDKPLPPIKPRKQYKISKEPKGDHMVEKKRMKKEKMRDPSLPEKVRPDVALIPKPPNGTEPNQSRDQTEGRRSLPNSREIAETQPTGSCLGNCRSHGCSEAYTRLFSSFYFKGNNGIMSPLAKKKLLAQVSQDECLYAHEKKHLSHCPEYKKIRIREMSGLDSEVGHPQKEAPKTGAEVNGSSSPPGPSQVGKTNKGLMKAPPGFREGAGSMNAEEESSGAHLSTGPPAFHGYFHTSSSTILKPISGLRGPVEYYPSLKDLPVTSPAYSKPGKEALVAPGFQKKQESLEDQPEDLRRKSGQPWKVDHQHSSAFQASTLSSKAGSPPFQPVKASWAPPAVNLAKVSPQVSKNGGLSVSAGQASITVQKKRASEEDYFLHGKKLKAVSPFIKEVDPNSGLDRGTSPSGQPGIAKPKATVAGSGFPHAHMPQIQDMYKGTMLRLPVNFSGSPGEHLKEQAPSLIQSLSINPFIIPAFPTPLLTASVQASDLGQPLGTSLVHYPTSYDSALRHRLYPVSTWHSQPTYATAHVPAYHRNNKL
ncbi:AT-rich interactive domain-containing protein 5A isoform X1 [Crotalus tigris]|uniref:AT-rich interactive domain-containing protein 5A isoform X1 n=2 Tax=Crotalus tigris TaxID=88082 RepID=UPI00192F6979|nr:AT-rich interactive domain-containing protein 5A isoform X1 [Crotalus tigris]